MEEQLISFFVEKNALAKDHIPILKEEQKKQDKTLKQLAIDLNFIEKEKALQLSSDFFNIPFICLKSISNLPVFDFNTHITPLKAHIFDADDTTLHIALEDPLDLLNKDRIRLSLERQKNYKIKNIKWYFGNLDHINNDTEITKEETRTDPLDEILEKAVSLNASDIHLKPQEKIVLLYFRINGVFVLQKTWHKNEQTLLTNRFKVLANLDIALSRVAQSGAFQKQFLNRIVHFRVSVHPTSEGESLAIRILDLTKKRLSLDDLGIQDDHLKKLKSALDLENGLILLTGPTGSGKTTTLYACLDYLSQKKLNIMTLEDPIECTLGYATQTEISSVFDYEMGVKSILRQDPDIILIGEIRDEITAQMAFRAAMTGHLVLSTLHTQSVETISSRLEDLKVSSHIIQTFLKVGMHLTFVKKQHKECIDKNCQTCYGSGIISRSLKTELKIF
jgi:type II secretory ATPase GspE/PulE/Tfp pilus assembly ATPase PilB-like protein